MNKLWIILLLPTVALGLKWHTDILCDGEKKLIKCKADEKLSIEKAFYGRSSDAICPSPQIRTTRCEAGNTLKVIGNLCNGWDTCEVEADPKILGDPCEGTQKYLEIHYVCYRPSKYPTKVVCEGESKSISCPNGHVINLKKGFYGRQDWTTCSHPSMKDRKCKAKKSFQKIKQLCQGKRSCSVTATNTLFGDPCRGTYKYIEMSYKCKKQETVNPCVDEDGNPISSDPFEKPGDCDNFYQCSNGQLHVMPCAPGTSFNPEVGVCDHSYNVPGC